MSTPISEEDGVLREWAPLSRLLGQIPLTVRKGLFFEDVKFTCIDAVSDSIVVGTNVGIVFWYDRNDHRVERLSPEKSGCVITAVKIVSTVDFMVAAGDTNGVISIFKIPKLLPDWLLSEVPVPQERKIERFTVGNLHISHITSLEWSLNGQKLFSGDSSGRVVFTEIDFFLNLTKAREILNENFTIVQLSYNQHLSALVVATIHRSIICYKELPKWRILQIGQKERSNLAELGGVFFTNESGSDPLVLSCRPGLRLWQANINGNVQRTIIFKDAVKNCTSDVPLLSNVEINSSSPSITELGRLHAMSEGLILSQTRSELLVLKVWNVSVKAKMSFARLISACATTSEIFVIPSDRDLIRLSFTPDVHDCSLSREGNVATAESVSSIPSFNLLPITGTLLESTSDARPVSMPCAVMYGQDSAILPPIVPIQEGVAELRLENAQRHVFPSIGHQQFDDIIYRKKNNKNKRWRRSYEEQKTKTFTDKLWNSISGDTSRHSVEETLIEMAMEVPSDFLSDLTNLDKIIQDARRQSQMEEDKSVAQDAEMSVKTEECEISVVPQQHKTDEDQNEINKSPRLYSESPVDDISRDSNVKLNEEMENNNIEEGCSYPFESGSNGNQIVPHCGPVKSDTSEDSIEKGLCGRSPSLHENTLTEDLNEKDNYNKNDSTSDDSNLLIELENNVAVEKSFEEQGNTKFLAECSINETICESLLDALDGSRNETLLLKGGATSMINEQIKFNPTINQSKMKTSILDSYFKSIEDEEQLKLDEENKDLISGLKTNSIRSPSLESVDIDKNSPAEASAMTESIISVDRSPLFSRVSECEELTDYYVIRREMSEDTKKKIHPWLNSLSDVGDSWKEVICPGRCISVTANEEEVVICTPELSAFRISYDDWERLESLAEMVDLAPCARLVAAVNCGVAHYSKKLVGGDWLLLGREVEHVSVDDKGIWFISRSELFFLPAGMHTAKKVNTDPYTLVKIYSRNEMIAGVTKEGKVVKFIGEVNNNWQLVITTGDPVKELAFGPGKHVWLLDIYNNLFVADNLTLPPSITVWWQVVIGNGFMVDVGAIYASDDCLYVCDAVKPHMYINRVAAKGHKWEASAELNCSQISAESLLEDTGSIWVLTKNNQLYFASPNTQSHKEVYAPWRVVCISCTPQTLWLLSEDGSVHIRQGISDATPMGTHWSDLNLEQIYDRNMQLVHISCGWDVVWACDIRGHVLMTVSSPHSITDDDMFSPAWVIVEGTPLHNNTFTKVYVGADSHMVWALDSAGNLYVREAIFPEYLLGADWVHVPGIKASHLCISGGAVWALAKEGVYRRVGITQSNYIGDSWILIPGFFDHISVSAINQLWGVNSSDGILMKHVERHFSIFQEPYSDSLSDWTFV